MEEEKRVKYVEVESVQQARGYRNHWNMAGASVDEGGDVKVPATEPYGGKHLVYCVARSMWETPNFPDREKFAELVKGAGE